MGVAWTGSVPQSRPRLSHTQARARYGSLVSVANAQHSRPGQTQHDTPPWLEHVPERFCEQDHEPSRHCAVGVPHATTDGTAPPLHVGLDGGGAPLTVAVTSLDAA